MNLSLPLQKIKLQRERERGKERKKGITKQPENNEYNGNSSPYLHNYLKVNGPKSLL